MPLLNLQHIQFLLYLPIAQFLKNKQGLLFRRREDDQIKIYSITNKGPFWFMLIRSCVLDVCQKSLKARAWKILEAVWDPISRHGLPTLSSFHVFTPLEIRLMKILLFNPQPIKNNRDLNIGLNMVWVKPWNSKKKCRYFLLWLAPHIRNGISPGLTMLAAGDIPN